MAADAVSALHLTVRDKGIKFHTQTITSYFAGDFNQ